MLKKKHRCTRERENSYIDNFLSIKKQAKVGNELRKEVSIPTFYTNQQFLELSTISKKFAHFV